VTTLPNRPDAGSIGDDTSGLPPDAYDAGAAMLYGSLMAQSALQDVNEISAISACAELAEALHLLGQEGAFVARCECEVTAVSDLLTAQYRVYSAMQHYVVVSPPARRTVDPSILRQVDASTSQLVDGKRLIVIPAVPSLKNDDKFRIVRAPLILDYRRFFSVEPIHTRSPRVLKIAINGLVYAHAVAAE
jgi:hypothetical protein